VFYVDMKIKEVCKYLKEAMGENWSSHIDHKWQNWLLVQMLTKVWPKV